jgi:hypothetical protein
LDNAAYSAIDDNDFFACPDFFGEPGFRAMWCCGGVALLYCLALLGFYSNIDYKVGVLQAA